MRRATAILALLWLAGIGAAAVWESRTTWLALRWLQETGPDVAVALGLCAVAWGLGAPLLRWALPRFAQADGPSRALISVALGWVVLETGAVLLGTFDAFSERSARALLGVLALPLPIHGISALRRGWAIRHEPGRAPPAASGETEADRQSWDRFGEGAAWALAAALMFPTLLAIGAPPVGPDEGQYHRRFVEHLLREGRFAMDPVDPESGFAQGFHAIAALGVSVGGIGAMRPMGWIFGLLSLLTGERIARRCFGPAGARIYLPLACGAVSWLRFLPTMNTDLPVGLFLGAAVLLVLDWLEDPLRRGAWPWLLGVLGGAALSIKYTTPFFFAPLFGVAGFALWRAARRGAGGTAAQVRGPLLALGLAALLPALFALPWMAKNVLAGCHPLFPMAGLDLPREQGRAFAYNMLEHYGAGRTVRAWARTPWDLFVLGREFDRRHYLGRVGPWPLLALPGMLILLRRGGRGAAVLVTAVAAFALWAAPLRRVIYLLALWPLLAAASAGAVAAMRAALAERWRPLATVLLAGTLVLSSVAEVASPWQDHLADAAAATGQETEEAYLDRRAPYHRAFRWIAENVPRGEAVASFWTWQYWGAPQRIVWLGGDEYTPMRTMLHRAGSPERAREVLAAHGVRWVIYRRLQLIRSGYPTLDDAQYEAGFVRPFRMADDLVTRWGVLRFEDGPYWVYELEDAPGTTVAPAAQHGSASPPAD